MIGLLQPLQNFWASFLFVRYTADSWHSPGSTVLFPANLLLALFLLLNRSERDRYDKLWKLVLLVNLFLAVLLMSAAGLVSLGARSPISVSEYRNAAALSIWGSLCFVADLVLLRKLFGRIEGRPGRGPVRLNLVVAGGLTFWALLAVPALFDGVLFSPIAHVVTAADTNIFTYIWYHCLAKLASCTVYALALTTYFVLWDRDELDALLNAGPHVPPAERRPPAEAGDPAAAGVEADPEAASPLVEVETGISIETFACPTPMPDDPNDPATSLLVGSHSFEQELHRLLRRRSNHGRWAAYYRTRPLGVRSRQEDLYRIADRKGIARQAVLIRWIHEDALPASD